MSQPGEQRGKGRYPRKGGDEKREPPSSEGRVPPHDLDAECAVLSAGMLREDALDRCIAILRPEHFYSEAHRRIFEGALELRGRGSPVDVVTVASWLKDRERIQQIGGMEYLASILNSAPEVANIEAYARIVHEKWQVRQMILMCQTQAARGYIDYGETSAFISSMHTDIERLIEHNTGFVFEGADSIMSEDPAQDDADFLIPAMQLGPGRAAMIGGDSYTGKSVICADIAVAIATGKDALGVFNVRSRGLVRWLNYDQNPKLARRRLRRVARAKGVDLEELRGKVEICHFPDFHIDDDGAVATLSRIFKGAKLGIIDALIGAVERTQEKDEAIGRQLLKFMHASHRTGCTFLVIHHTIKPQAEFPGKKQFRAKRDVSALLRGNRAIMGACDSMLVLESTGKKKPVRVHHVKAPNDGNTLDEFYLSFEDIPEPDRETFDADAEHKPLRNSRWGLRVNHMEAAQIEREEEAPAKDTRAGDAERRAAFEQLLERVLETIKTYPGLTGRAVKKLLDKVPPEQVDSALTTLKNRKLAEFDPGPRRSQLWRAV